jgi:acyl dehydratase
MTLQTALEFPRLAAQAGYAPAKHCRDFKPVNALVLDMHPYVADDVFAKEEGAFGRRLVAGAMVFSLGLGLMAHNNIHTFSYGYDKVRFIKPVFIGDTIYTIRTQLEKWPKYPQLGMVRVSYEVFKVPGELVLYCEHLQTVRYRNAPSQ